MTKRIASKSPGQPTQRRSERVGILFSELELAVKWGRPSILIAVYDDPQIRRNAERNLARRLARIGQETRDFRVSEAQFDIPVALAAQPDKGNVVFLVSGLRQGDGALGARAYKALNIRREYLVDHRIRVVLWLSETEAVDLPRRAPDFWAFRHRVVDFVTEPAHAPRSTLRFFDQPTAPADLPAQIAYRESLLTDIDGGNPQTDFDLRFGLAGLLWLQGDFVSARARLEEALDAAVRSADTGRQFQAFLGLGIVRASAGQFEEAAAAFHGAAALDPGSDIPLVRMSALLFARGDLPGAMRAAEQAVRINPDSASAWSALGDLLTRHGDLPAAHDSLSRAVGLDHRLAPAWHALGICEAMRGDLAPAYAALRKACRLAPGCGAYWLSLASLYQDMGQGPAALRAARKAARLTPGVAAIWLVVGSLLQMRRVFAEAWTVFQTAESLSPHDMLPALCLADCAIAQGDPVLGARWSARAGSLPEASGPLMQACYLAWRGELQQAQAMLQLAARQDLVRIHELRHFLFVSRLLGESGFATWFAAQFG